MGLLWSADAGLTEGIFHAKAGPARYPPAMVSDLTPCTAGDAL